MSENTKEILRVENLYKSFVGVKALQGVDLTLSAGEVCGLVGENGAGKSTLIKCMMGVHHKDSGRIFLNDRIVHIRNPQHALELGLCTVYQDVMLAPHLSVGENFFLGSLPTKFGAVDWNTIYSETDKILHELNIQVNSKAILGRLPIAKQEMVAIAKMFYHDCKVAVFDEPTALLSTEETETCHGKAKMSQKGKGENVPQGIIEI